MKFRMFIRNKDSGIEPWHEDEDNVHITSLEEAEEWAKEIIVRFNTSLMVNELPRELIRVEVLDLEGESHDWEKTNLVTIIDKHGVYDTMQCKQYSITGKRHGLGPYITRDREFAAPGYDSCKQAKILLERREKRRAKKNREVKNADSER